MRRILALQWNQTEADALVASAGGERMVIEEAFRVALPEDNDGDGSPEKRLQRWAAEWKARRIGRADAVVALGRNRAEMRHLTLPSAPDEELPDLVRFQAVRQFSALEEDWPLDFVPLNGPEEESRYVLAAAVRPELLGEVQQACEESGLKAARVVLQPCAAASLLVRLLGPRCGGTWLLVSLAGGEADLAVLVDGRVAFLRQTRLPGDPLGNRDLVPALAVELRRTMAAAQNQPGSRPVESIAFLGAGDRCMALAASIGKELSLPCEAVDPFEGVQWNGSEPEDLLKSPGRWAPLVGMIWDEAAESPPALDFLHPRKRPEPPSRRNTYALAGLAGGLVVLAIMAASWIQGDRLNADVRRLQANSKALDKNVEQAAKSEAAAKEVDDWVDDEINWLQELRWLSERLPSAEDAMLTQVKFNANSGRGEITLDGLARNVEAVAKLDRDLHDELHRLAGKSKSESDDKRPYGVQFRSSVRIEKGK